MKYNRTILNNIKTITVRNANKIISVYESINADEQYAAFLNMSQNHLDYWNFWLKKFKPLFWKLQNKKYKLYKDYYLTAQFGLDRINSLIDAYYTNLNEIEEQEEFFNNLKTKLTAEYMINEELQEEHYNKIKEQDNKKIVGFTAYKNKPKRKYTKRKKDD